jgi:hypothetical protein
MMQAKQQEDIVQRRVGTTVVRNELRLQKWGLSRERSSPIPVSRGLGTEAPLLSRQTPLRPTASANGVRVA